MKKIQTIIATLLVLMAAGSTYAQQSSRPMVPRDIEADKFSAKSSIQQKEYEIEQSLAYALELAQLQAQQGHATIGDRVKLLRRIEENMKLAIDCTNQLLAQAKTDQEKSHYESRLAKQNELLAQFKSQAIESATAFLALMRARG